MQEFKYLGTTHSSRDCGRAVKNREQVGWNSWRKVSGLICDRRVSAKVKEKVYRTVVRPSMMYGLGTLAIGRRQEAELEVAELKLLRFSLGVTRMDRIRNKVIRGTTQTGRLGEKTR